MEKHQYWRNSADQWGIVSRILHWTMALLIIGMIIVGLYINSLPDIPFKFLLIGLHKSTGVIILGLVVFRLFWRLSQSVPTLPPMPQTHQFLAKASVPVLYLFLFIMPISGIIMSQSFGYSISVYGWFTFPEIVGKNPEIGKLAAATHQLAGWILIGLIILHIVAAFYHQFCRKDYLLTRMWRSKE